MAAWSFKRAFESELTDVEDGSGGVGRHRSTATGMSAEASTINDASTASGTGLPVFSEDEAQEESTGGSRLKSLNNTVNNDDGLELIEQGEDFTSVQSCEVKNGHWICKPYKREMIAQQFENNSPGASRRTAIIGALRDLGVKVFIIEAKSIKSTKDILHHVKRVVGFVARENRIQVRTGPLGFQRCLLYQDQQGRLFNLMLAKHAIGPAAKYQDYLDTFSGLQAMVAIVVLCRSFPCARSANIEQLKPAYLSLILGLVFTEELSLSGLNSSMLVRASPSVSAHTLTNNVGSDILRKLIVLSLALAAAASGLTQKILTLFGISAACAVFLSNLGSRAWHFMRWRPLRYQGLGAGFVAWVASILAGLCIPYMGHRSIETGGKAALEHILISSFAVAITFVVSDIDELQKFLIVGSESCNQDYVNIAVGGWWCFTLVCSLLLVRKIPYKDHHPYYDGEPLLMEDHASPVGYKVPSIPDFEIDPSLAKTGSPCIPYSLEFIVGILMAMSMGGGIMYLAFTDVDEQIVGTMQNVTKSM